MNNFKQELAVYRNIFENELKNDILDFWLRYSIDSAGGGFYGAVDLAGNPVVTANKSCVLNSRILWTFSAAALLCSGNRYGETADRAFFVLQNHFADKVNGGYFMELTPENKVAVDIKHTYAQAFVIYSLCKYYEYTKTPRVLEIIKMFFTLFESMTKDPANPGYFEAFTSDWKPYGENRMADNNEPRSMNTHLHVLEAYTALFKIWKDDRVKLRLSGLINLFLNRIIRQDGHLGIFFNEQFVESHSSEGICSFGHDIEASWLLWEAAVLLDDKGILDKMRPLSVKMTDAVERSGVDKDGGLFLESTRFGSHLRTNKHWWLQAENLVGFMNAFQLSGDLKYWETVKKTWSFIDNHVIDHERGEWYTKVSRSGVPFLIEPPGDPSPYYRNDWKIDPWKCPYHNGRAMMELMHRIDLIMQSL